MNRAATILLPLLGALSILLVWQFVLPLLGVPAFIVPTPATVARKLVTDAGLLAANALPTALESVLGFLIGNLAAVLLAILFVYSRPIRAAYFPAVLFFNTIPILALAPIIVLIFGLGILPKIVIAAVICFFPTLVNMIRGLEMPTRSEFELFRILSASPFETFWRLRVPRSLPLLFTSLKISATTSVIGAIVGEWIGANQGLGALIIQSTFNYQTDRLYAAVITSSALGLLFFGSVVLAERLVMRRHPA
ncbi:MAG TPA: ABC transporter permease [Geminicoccus sp.]|uniref:ABC transporter permease n=1 Tax=Geminicoccus sp. TaxID=2024832 RepID=UPI002CABCC9A|nr:ABC transporter permease [Geminicoccus sp.]HWL68137.1 ABC transporter permease [Geminicoccus sp.]